MPVAPGVPDAEKGEPLVSMEENHPKRSYDLLGVRPPQCGFSSRQGLDDDDT